MCRYWYGNDIKFLNKRKQVTLKLDQLAIKRKQVILKLDQLAIYHNASDMMTHHILEQLYNSNTLLNKNGVLVTNSRANKNEFIR